MGLSVVSQSKIVKDYSIQSHFLHHYAILVSSDRVHQRGAWLLGHPVAITLNNKNDILLFIFVDEGDNFVFVN